MRIGKRLVSYLYYLILKISFALRYKIRVEGAEQLSRDHLMEIKKNKGGILFLSNHPAFYVDLCSLFLTFWPRFKFKPLINESAYATPLYHSLLKSIETIRIPDFVTSSTSKKRQELDLAVAEAVNGLNKGENFLVFPSPNVKWSAMENIGTNQLAYEILTKAQDATIVMVRIKGLWGSSYSRAINDKAPKPLSAIFKAIWTAIRNGIFFVPRREIVIEVEVAPAIFPWNATRHDVNLNLETWFNRPDGFTQSADDESKPSGDTLRLVPYSRKDKPSKLASLKSAAEEKKAKEMMDLWQKKRPHTRADIAPGSTIAEAFLNQCARSKNNAACADERLGVQTYSQFKLRAILLAEHLRKLPGKYIGIMLPSSVAAYLIIIACELAGKIPLMINWTVGPRHLEWVLASSKVQVVISSRSFLERLDNVDLNGVDDLFLMLEDIVAKVSLKDKVTALLRSKKSTLSILKTFGVHRVSGKSPAVLLFTSGTESNPKGVPLSHQNILSDLRMSISLEHIYTDDVVFGFLPPFHSFGFSVAGLLGLLSGVRCYYFPNPNEGKKLIRAFERWQGTILFSSPTFLKTILKFVVKESQIRSLRLCILGAERSPPELYGMLQKFNKADVLTEGYGITECSPVLTLNPLGEKKTGVGKPLPGVELRIVHPETEEPLPIGTAGLVLARGPNVFEGYLNNDNASPFTFIDGVYWYKTGDMGYLDENGYLTLTGRYKRFVKIGGEMVSLLAIEDAIASSAAAHDLPVSNDVPTFAVAAKEVAGEKSRIILFSQFEVHAEQINKILKEAGFSNLVKISSVTVLSKIPVTGTGKVNYGKLRELLEESKA